VTEVIEVLTVIHGARPVADRGSNPLLEEALAEAEKARPVDYNRTHARSGATTGVVVRRHVP
jgi:hypothetical protein